VKGKAKKGENETPDHCFRLKELDGHGACRILCGGWGLGFPKPFFGLQRRGGRPRPGIGLRRLARLGPQGGKCAVENYRGRGGGGVGGGGGGDGEVGVGWGGRKEEGRVVWGVGGGGEENLDFSVASILPSLCSTVLPTGEEKEQGQEAVLNDAG